MLKTLVILGMSVAALGMAGQPDKTAQHKQAVARDAKPSPVESDSPKKEEGGDANQPKADTNPPNWYAALERPDWWVVLAAFSTIGVICWQSIETRKAAQGALLAADAGIAQLQLMKDKERARIQVTAVDFSTVYLDENITNRMTIEFLNLGPTHAFNVRAEGDGWFSVKDFAPQEFELTDLVLPTVLRANTPETSWVPLYFNGEAGEEVRNMKAKTEIEMMGSVEYSDVFGDNHKTSFHYRMFVYGWEKDVAPNKSFKMKRMGGWRKAGPPEDNHAT